MIWVAWPKRASKIETDMTENVIREIVLPSSGLVDVKVCAIDHVWSGLKLVIRKDSASSVGVGADDGVAPCGGARENRAQETQSGTFSAVTVWLASSLISRVASLWGMSNAMVPRTRSPACRVPVSSMASPAPSIAVSKSRPVWSKTWKL